MVSFNGQVLVFFFFGFLYRHIASPSITSGTHTGGDNTDSGRPEAPSSKALPQWTLDT